MLANHANTFWQIICIQPVSMNLSSCNCVGHPRIFNAGYLIQDCGRMSCEHSKIWNDLTEKTGCYYKKNTRRIMSIKQ